MPHIIGTAGHIDHGKTSLIKALTGQDTDRLKEEKERGISIDLGFAHFDLPDGQRAGIVDVPGHERFIRNMLAGAHGMDLVLFTVAADDGVMPQTEEHLDILHLLRVRRAIFVITKVDLVSPARVADVQRDIEFLTAGTSLEHSPIVPFSAVTGEGLDRLRSTMAHLLEQWEKPRPPGYFRLPVDRVFVLRGHGLVVTGTASSGQVGVGDRVRCLPGGQLFRVRSLQVHNESKDRATWGQRVALNLSGQERSSMKRGDVICHERLTMTSARFDASLDVRPGVERVIRSHQGVRVHLGTAERLGKVILVGRPEGAGLEADTTSPTFCQIVLREPVMTLRGDRFILRDETAQRTLGGGGVLFPWASRHTINERDLQEKLTLLQEGTLGGLALAFLDQHDGFALPIAPLYQFLNVEEHEARHGIEGLDGIHALIVDGETFYTTSQKWNHLKEAVLEHLGKTHAAQPLAPGADMEALRDRMPTAIAPKQFRAALERLEGEKAIVREGNLVRLPLHEVRLRPDELILVDKILALLGSRLPTPPDVPQIAQEIGVGRKALVEVIRVMERERTIVRVAPDLYFLPESIQAAKTALCRYLIERGTITSATFRDLFGTSRKYAIPLLEHFDREGLTVRVGDARRLRNAP